MEWDALILIVETGIAVVVVEDAAVHAVQIAEDAVFSFHGSKKSVCLCRHFLL